MQRKVGCLVSNAAPLYLVVVAPKCYGEEPEIPKDGTQSSEPLSAEHDVVSAQRNCLQVNDERLVSDGDHGVAANSDVDHPLTVGHDDTQIHAWHKGEVGLFGGLGRHKVVCRPRVE